MKAPSLAGRLTLLQQLVATIGIVAFAASALWLSDHTLLRDESRFLLQSARHVAANVDNELVEEPNLVIAARAALREESGIGMGIDVYDPQGRRLASTRPPRGALPTEAPLPDPDRTDERGGWHRAAARARCGALVVTWVSEREHVAGMSALARSLLWCALPLLVLSHFVSRWMARRALRPLAAMSARAQSASAHAGVRSLGQPVGLVEIDRLSESFNRLLSRLDDVLQSERRFTSDAAHELRTPLTALSGELEVALSDPSLSPPARGGLERAAGETRAMCDLVEALLLLRRAGGSTLDPEAGLVPVNLSDVAADVVRAARERNPLRAADLTLRAPDEILVVGHEVLLASALSNLVTNALQFTQAGEQVRVGVDSDTSAVTVTVDDAGAGVAPEDRERVFDAFYRSAEARARHHGFGLGLHILRQVARAHGGDVALEPSMLGGARFTIRLPRAV